VPFIVGAVLGYIVGVFAASNVILPLLWSWPKARRLRLNGMLLRPIPAVLFLIAPTVWSLLVLGSAVLIGAFFAAAFGGYAIGLLAAFGQTMRLVGAPNNDMEADFAATYRDYLPKQHVTGKPRIAR
jgi:hypothetical protein